MASAKHIRDEVHPEFKFKLFEYGLEYYVSGRFAVMAKMNYTPGSHFHHAIEMMLKAEMVKKMSLRDVMKQFRHGLVDLWNAFKGEFPGEDLSEFDPVIEGLHAFWDIRYPDELFQKGAILGFGWQGPAILSSAGPATRNVPTYQLSVRAIDRLVVRLAVLVSVNVPPFIHMILNSEMGRTALSHESDDIRHWL
jgi:hypothetical protein